MNLFVFRDVQGNIFASGLGRARPIFLILGQVRAAGGGPGDRGQNPQNRAANTRQGTATFIVCFQKMISIMFFSEKSCFL